MSNHMQPIPMLAEYCGDGNPVIAQEFSDRWRSTNFRKRASVSWLRKLRAAGVTHVAVEIEPGSNPVRVADFSIAELVRS